MKAPIYTYYLSSDKHGSWGKFIIDGSGYFSCVTDFGNYAFQWTAIGPGDFRSFLVSLNADYVMGKLNWGRGLVFDDDKTRNLARTKLLEKRRERMVNSDEAREIWDSMEGCTTEREFEDVFRKAKDIHDYDLFDDWWEMFGQNYPAELLGFGEKVWPRFVALLKEELAEVAK